MMSSKCMTNFRKNMSSFLASAKKKRSSIRKKKFSRRRTAVIDSCTKKNARRKPMINMPTVLRLNLWNAFRLRWMLNANYSPKKESRSVTT
jgi:hypothetical protein